MKKQKQPAPNADTNSKPVLRLDWCTHEAAKYAVEKWHYSKRMPKSKLAKIGVWEDGKFIGVVIFGVGATPEIAKPYKVTSLQICELVRVALTNHKSQTSRVVAIAIRILKESMPGLRVIVSFADSSQGHHGGIYQAGGWAFCGSSSDTYICVNGIIEHRRTLGHQYGTSSLDEIRKRIDPQARKVNSGLKHKYVYPLDSAMRAQIEPLRKPYPKRVRSVDSDTSANHAEEGGANPTRTLSSPEANQ